MLFRVVQDYFTLSVSEETKPGWNQRTDYPSVHLKLPKELTNSPACFIVNVPDILHILFQPSVGLDAVPVVIHHLHPRFKDCRVSGSPSALPDCICCLVKCFVNSKIYCTKRNFRLTQSQHFKYLQPPPVFWSSFHIAAYHRKQVIDKNIW